MIKEIGLFGPSNPSISWYENNFLYDQNSKNVLAQEYNLYIKFLAIIRSFCLEIQKFLEICIQTAKFDQILIFGLNFLQRPILIFIKIIKSYFAAIFLLIFGQI